MLTVDHRFALSNPALLSAPSKKSFSSVSSPILACSRLRRCVATAGSENVSRPALELRLPRCDLIGVHVELLRKLSQCAITLDGSKRHLCLQGRCVVPARNCRRCTRSLLICWAQRARRQAETPPIVLFRFSKAGSNREPCAGEPRCIQLDDIRPTSVTEEREVLYPWHPWFERRVFVHEVVDRGCARIFRCAETAREADVLRHGASRIAARGLRRFGATEGADFEAFGGVCISMVEARRLVPYRWKERPMRRLDRHRHARQLDLSGPTGRVWKGRQLPEKLEAVRHGFAGAPHSGLARLISRINWRTSSGTVGRPRRGLDRQANRL